MAVTYDPPGPATIIDLWLQFTNAELRARSGRIYTIYGEVDRQTCDIGPGAIAVGVAAGRLHASGRHVKR